jgi:hypothetical protein
MAFKTCQHIMEDGYLCQSPAMRDRRHCYYHSNWRARRMAMARARSRGEKWWFTLPPLEDMRAVQSAIAQVIEALAAELIDPKHAQALLNALRLASHNFRATRAWIGHRSRYLNDGRYEHIDHDPGLEQSYGLPDGIDLEDDPQEVFPIKAEPINSAKAERESKPAAGGKNNTSRVAKHSNHRPPQTAPARDYADVDPVKAVAEVRAFARQALSKLQASGSLPPSLLKKMKKQPASVSGAPAKPNGHSLTGAKIGT